MDECSPCITARPKSALQPENAIVIKPWKIADEDKQVADPTLLDHMPFLVGPGRCCFCSPRHRIASARHDVHDVGRHLDPETRVPKCASMTWRGRAWRILPATS